ncbi:MAG: NAD-dependent epimerase/dehydratase family protein [Candidatus Eremiobacteraeota bacterium]|nr:NAD-dependent epimerase/dehydratase family protein [Candidatus Eremiobacteraeota bacterium]
MRTAFVTGGSGFVGANLVRALLAGGWRVRALVRGDSPSLLGLGVEIVRGDLFIPHLADAMRGCDALFHVAAAYSLWRRDRDDVLRTNVDGTRAVLAAARAAGVPRTVHTSSVAAIGVRADGTPADETYQSPPERLIGTYKKSKYFGEREARRAFEAGQDVVIVNPTTPLGPWDVKPTPTGEIVVRFLRRRMPAYVETGLNLIDVRDVAAGHILAYERGVAGERYILGHENLSLRALLDRLAAITGLPAPRVRLPRAIPLAYAALGEHVLARMGIAPDVSVESVRMAKQRMFYVAEKAVRELGLPQSDGTNALADAVTWFRDHGYDRDIRPTEDGWRSLSSRP